MKNGKILFIATLLLVSLLCLSAVSAADDAASDVIADNTDETILDAGIDDADLGDSEIDELGESDEIALDNAADEDTLGLPAPHGFSDLNNDINGNNNSLITLNYGYNYIDDGYDNGIHISRDVTIDGNGNTISGNGRAPIFCVDSGTVTFKNIRFINGLRTASYDCGAAIYGGTAINCTFENNRATGGEGNGGAMAYGTAINCTFIENQGYGGGAIAYGTAINCTFYNNNAGHAGAMYRSDATNCVFVANHVEYEGGAMFGGTATNCVFLSNSARNGENIYNTDCKNCIFAESAYLTVPNPAIVNVGKNLLFTLKTGDEILNNVPTTIAVSQNGEEIGTFYGLSGEGLTVYLDPGTYTATFSVDNANVDPVTVSMIVTSGTSFTDLNKLINEDYLSNTTITLNSSYKYTDGDDAFAQGIIIGHGVTIDGNGFTLDGSDAARIFRIETSDGVTLKNINFINGHPKGQYISEEVGGAIFVEERNGNNNVINCNFTNNKADFDGGAIYCSGSNLNVINSTFTNNYASAKSGAMQRGNAINCTFIENKADYRAGVMLDATAINCIFINNTSPEAGAMYECNAIDCTFIGNYVDNDGGAIAYGNAVNCTFTGNSAYHGGAISSGDAVNCTFTGNYANYGGAIAYGNAVNCTFNSNNAITNGQGGAIFSGSAENCIFKANCANYLGGAIYNGAAENCIFTDNSAGSEGGAICGDINTKEFCSAVNCTFNNNHAWAGGAMFIGNAVNCSFTGNSAEAYGGAISSLQDYDPCDAVNCIFTDNSAGYSGGGDDIYKGTADTCVFNGDGYNYVEVLSPILKAVNFISTYEDGTKLVVNLTSSSGMPIANANIKFDIYTTAREFVGTYTGLSGGWTVPLNAGTYIVVFNATDFDIDTVEGMIVVNKATSAITSKAVTAIYNNNKYLTITLKDAYGKAISGAKVTVTLASAKTYTTDKNGQIKINVGKLVPKTYTAKIKFAGNTNLLASSTTAKVTVKKATPKMTAKAKTFKVKVKTKKYTITLKNNKGKVLKSTKVTLKVNKKTFTAKTNKKGVATFKITNLKKKGKFTATIKYAGNKYYNKLTKKVKITVKK